MNGLYSHEDIERLKRDTLMVIRKRVVAEFRLQFAEEENNLERMCQMGGEESSAFEERCMRMCKLTEECSGYMRREIEAVEKYLNACSAYRRTLN
jgi:hypothetical protein